MEVRQGPVEPAGDPHPVVDVARRDHQVRRAGRNQRPGGGVESGDFNGAPRRAVGIPRLERRAVAADAGHIAPAGGEQIRREDFGPVAAGRGDLDYRHAGRQAPEGQGLGGMTKAIPDAVGGRALRAVHRRHEGGRGLGGGAKGKAYEAEERKGE